MAPTWERFIGSGPVRGREPTARLPVRAIEHRFVRRYSVQRAHSRHAGFPHRQPDRLASDFAALRRRIRTGGAGDLLVLQPLVLRGGGAVLWIAASLLRDGGVLLAERDRVPSLDHLARGTDPVDHRHVSDAFLCFSPPFAAAIGVGELVRTAVSKRIDKRIWAAILLPLCVLPLYVPVVSNLVHGLLTPHALEAKPSTIPLFRDESGATDSDPASVIGFILSF